MTTKAMLVNVDNRITLAYDTFSQAIKDFEASLRNGEKLPQEFQQRLLRTVQNCWKGLKELNGDE